MTAESELFVTEGIRDVIEEKMRRLFPGIRYYEIVCPPEWQGIWDPSSFPERGEAVVTITFYRRENFLTEDDIAKVPQGVVTTDTYQSVPIAKVEWETKFYIEHGMGGRYIEADVGKVRVKRLVRPSVWRKILLPKQVAEYGE